MGFDAAIIVMFEYIDSHYVLVDMVLIVCYGSSL